MCRFSSLPQLLNQKLLGVRSKQSEMTLRFEEQGGASVVLSRSHPSHYACNFWSLKSLQHLAHCTRFRWYSLPLSIFESFSWRVIWCQGLRVPRGIVMGSLPVGWPVIQLQNLTLSPAFSDHLWYLLSHPGFFGSRC